MAISAAVLATKCSVAFTVGILMPNKELGQLTAVLGHLPCGPDHFRVPGGSEKWQSVHQNAFYSASPTFFSNS